MEKDLISAVAVLVFCALYTAAIAAQTKNEAATRLESAAVAPGSEAQAMIQKLGFGKRVNVTLQNGTKASGRITGVAVQHFVITDSKGTAIPVSYSEVSRITKQKEKLGIFHRPWVGIMFTAAGVGTLIVMALALMD